MEKKKILLLCWATYVTAYLCRINFSVAIPKLAADLSVPMELLGIASSVYFVAYALGQLCNGFLSDRLPPYRFLLLALIATTCMNFAIPFCTGVAAVTIFWGCNGYFQSIFWGTLLRLLSLHYTSQAGHKNVSTVMSTCSVTGYFLSWTLLGKLLENSSSSFYFFLPAIPAAILVPAWLITARNHPVEEMLAQRPAVPPLRQSLQTIAAFRLQWVSILCLGIGAIQEGAVFWLPVMFSQLLNLNYNQSLLCLMIVPIAKLLGVFAARWCLGQTGNNPRRTEGILVTAAFLTTMLLALTAGGSSWITVIFIGLLILFINGANWILISYLPLRFSSQNMVATLVGIFDFSVYIGAAISAPILGFSMGKYGFPAVPLVWLVLSVFCLLLLCTAAGKSLGKTEEVATQA